MRISCSCFTTVLLLAIAMASRSSLAARESSRVPASIGHDLMGLFSKATAGVLGSVGWKGAEGWHDAAADSKVKSLTGKRAPRLKKGVVANCVPAKLCRKKRVLCAKKCYKARSGLNHLPAKCVVKCKKCVPTC